jgi:prophage regulatory protein
VIEFPTYRAAVECYRSPEYAKAMALRQGNSIMDLSIVEGYDGPQPSDQ